VSVSTYDTMLYNMVHNYNFIGDHKLLRI